MMVSFVLSFFPRDVLDEVLNLIGSVSEGFPSYSCMFYTKDRDSFEYCLRENDVVPLEEKQKIKEELSKVKHRKLILKTDQPTGYLLIDLFHIVFAHACIGHVTRYFSIIGETLQRWGKRILSHWRYLCN